MRKFVLTSILLVFAVVSMGVSANNQDFPGRKEFPNVATYELTQLRDKFNDVILIDTRSHYEYDTLRIKGAVNIPVADKTFEQQVEVLRAKSNKPIVFYCNGRTCYKSYLAVKKSNEAGIDNTHAFDAGMFEWATAHPDKAVLLGKSPVDLKKLIASSNYKKRLLDPDTFSEKAATMGSASMVLDVRDKYQRAGIGFFPGKERWVSLDDKEKLAKYLEKAKTGKKTLFIYDEVGKQVRWLQYALEEMGITNYYFMEKGAKAYYATLSTWK